MATGLSNVFQKGSDFNIGVASAGGAEKVSGMLFDVTGVDGFFSDDEFKAVFENAVVEFESLNDFKESVLYTKRSALHDIARIACYHIEHYYGVVASGRLFVCFGTNAVAEGSKTDVWKDIIAMQKSASGLISQIGVWTNRSLWKTAVEGDEYGLSDIVSSLNATAVTLADIQYSAPLVIVLNANTYSVDGSAVTLSKIPSVKGRGKEWDLNWRYVSVCLGEGTTDLPTVSGSDIYCFGTIGCALGLLANGNVGNSIAWVERGNVGGRYGDVTLGIYADSLAVEGKIAYDAVDLSDLNDLDSKGYVILRKYSGLEGGVYFSSDTTASHIESDYRTLSRNRVINKSRRLVRAVLLPYVNSPILVNPATGLLSPATITNFTNIVTAALNSMVTSGEITEIGSVIVPADQNVLQTDTVKMSYRLIPLGAAKYIEVEDGFSLSQGQ